jgi:dATP pyrophosphohydrolase
VIDLTIARPRGTPASDDPHDHYEVLQLQRTRDPLRGTWQPVMGHIEGDESATAASMREAREEVGLNIADASVCTAFWALEQVHPYFIASIDCVVLSPRFLALVAPGWIPVLNNEHAAFRWVALRDAPRHSTWPGQRAALAEVATILAGQSIEGPWLKIDPASAKLA